MATAESRRTMSSGEESITYVHVRDQGDAGYRFLCDTPNAEVARIQALIAANPDIRQLEVNLSGGEKHTFAFDRPLARCWVGELTPTVISGTVQMGSDGMLHMDVTDVNPM